MGLFNKIFREETEEERKKGEEKSRVIAMQKNLNNNIRCPIPGNIKKVNIFTYIAEHPYILEIWVYVLIALVIGAFLYRFGYFDIFIKF